MKLKTVKIGKKKVGEEEPCFIIAEIGINHNGSVTLAKLLIDMAKQAGCDAVKFQKRTIEIVYTREELAKYRESPFGETNEDLKRKLEFGYKQYREIDRYCKQKKIIWFASCWDEDSVDFLEQFDPPCYKIASPSLTDDHLLKHIKSIGKPIILSTGMSTMEQIEHAIDILSGSNPVLLHCTSNYPAKNEESNLRMIPVLKEKFGLPVGYSGHETGVTPSVIAVGMGACVVERHITLDRAMWGSDQAASLERKGLELMVRDIGLWPICKGDGVKKVYESEEPNLKKLRRVNNVLDKN